MKFFKFILGLCLLPLCAALAWACFRAAVVIVECPDRLPGAEAAAAVAGIAAWLLAWRFLPPATKTYVLGHELTHALWTLFFGGRPSHLRVAATGGSVRVTKNNVWVTLAPYFFPLYTVLAVLLWLLLRWLLPPSARFPLALAFLFLVAFTWSFHIAYTLKFLAVSQPDVREHGRLFSYALIFALNLAAILLALTLPAPWTFRDLGGWLLDSLRAQAAFALRLYDNLRPLLSRR